ncbi:hypothetical protein NECAME_09844 [Necator americanus]|uniref:Uncharacterized protein n=1 Tax=Necator americanus TaxID=51031 RepID=W2TDY7_NECAM|nr:hypothetical protein NECAME_09844 [Necator americanus]ETN79406.1 hypothetical protein NECAME_09844 [Necator americanus]
MQATNYNLREAARLVWALVLTFFVGLTVYQVFERIAYYFISQEWPFGRKENCVYGIKVDESIMNDAHWRGCQQSQQTITPVARLSIPLMNFQQGSPGCEFSQQCRTLAVLCDWCEESAYYSEIV